MALLKTLFQNILSGLFLLKLGPPRRESGNCGKYEEKQVSRVTFKGLQNKINRSTESFIRKYKLRK